MEKNVVAIIVQILLNLGISPNTKGYYYLRKGILICVTSSTRITALNKIIYPHIAEHYSTSESSVERAVRHSIKSGWYRHDQKLAEKIFMNTLQSINDVPTNSVFITTIAEWIKVNHSDLL